jgi:hypothetical protein
MCDSGLEKLKEEHSNSYMHPNLYCAIKCEENFIFYNNIVICHSRGLLIPVDNVSMELIYVGWDFGDHHCDNFRAILAYNLNIDEILFEIVFLLFVLHLFNVFVCLYFVIFLTPF